MAKSPLYDPLPFQARMATRSDRTLYHRRSSLLPYVSVELISVFWQLSHSASSATPTLNRHLAVSLNSLLRRFILRTVRSIPSQTNESLGLPPHTLDSLGDPPLPMGILGVPRHLFDFLGILPHQPTLGVPSTTSFMSFPALQKNHGPYCPAAVSHLAPSYPSRALLRLQSCHLKFCVLAASESNHSCESTVCSPL